MRASVTTAISIVAALSGRMAAAQDCPTLPVEGPFYLSLVRTDGLGPFLTDMTTVSHGVPILTPAKSSSKQFTWNAEERRVLVAGSDVYKSGKVSVGGSFYFHTEGNGPEDGTFLLEQIVSDCAVYLVREGTAPEESVYQWSSNPPNSTWAEVIYFKGAGSEANTAIRVDLEKP